jgi:putative polyhydroxyalkanoate system protein
MPKFGVTVPHKLGKENARSRLEQLIQILEKKYEGKVSDIDQSWDGDTLRFRVKTFGIQLSGNIAVSDNELKLDGELPFAAMMFKGKIESDFKEQLERLVAS